MEMHSKTMKANDSWQPFFTSMFCMLHETPEALHFKEVATIATSWQGRVFRKAF
jgi:hypothetical protein